MENKDKIYWELARYYYQIEIVTREVEGLNTKIISILIEDEEPIFASKEVFSPVLQAQIFKHFIN